MKIAGHLGVAELDALHPKVAADVIDVPATVVSLDLEVSGSKVEAKKTFAVKLEARVEVFDDAS